MAEKYCEIREVRIGDLIHFGLRFSQVYQGERLRQLMDSIERVGLMNPIIVRSVADGKYEIICGHNRARAMEALGRDVICAEVRTGITDDEALELFYDSNLNQQSFSDWSYSQKIEAIKYAEKMIKMNSQQGKRTDLHKDDEPGDGTSVQCRQKSSDRCRKGTTRDRMARRLGIATATLSKYRSIVKLPDDVSISIAKLLDEKRLTLEAAYRISGLSLWMVRQLIDCIDKSPDKKVDMVKLRALRAEVEAEAAVPICSKARVEKILVPRDSKKALDTRGVRNLEKVDFTPFPEGYPLKAEYEMNNRDEALIWVFEDAIDYIAERCDVDRNTIEKVMLLDEDYVDEMKDEPIWDFDDEIEYIAERCDVDWDTIEKVMLLNEDYMRSIGIVEELPESMVEEINEIIKQKNEKKK